MTERPPLRVLLLSHGQMGRGLLHGLMTSPHAEVVGVFPWSIRQRRQGKISWMEWLKPDLDEVAFLKAIHTHRVRLITHCDGVNTHAFKTLLQQLQPDIVLVGTWGEIFKPDLLAHPETAFINCHPSLLPTHRGPNPYVAAIRAGDVQSGITFHHMSQTVDTGPLLLQSAFAITPTDTGGDLKDKCAQQALSSVEALMSALYEEALTPQSQDESQATRHARIKLEDGTLDWTQAPVQLERQVRGLQPWLDCYGFVVGSGPLYWLGPCFVTIQAARLAPRDQRALPDPHPGRVAGMQGSEIRVETSDPQTYFCITRFRLYAGIGYWPRWIGNRLAPWIFHPGAQFWHEASDGA